jgi:hypothetical protein
MWHETQFVQTREFEEAQKGLYSLPATLAEHRDAIERMCGGQYFTVPLFHEQLGEIIDESGNEAGRVTLARALLTEETFDTWARYNNILFLATNPRGEVPAY